MTMVQLYLRLPLLLQELLTLSSSSAFDLPIQAYGLIYFYPASLL